MNITLIPAEICHLDLVYNFIRMLESEETDRELFAANYAANLADDNIIYRLICASGEICGFVSVHLQILLHHNAVVAEIQELIIDEAYRSKGAGGKALRQIELLLNDRGITQLEVCTNRKRDRTIKFYSGNDFSETHCKFTKKL